ncbi:hypothetical protein [Bifidobacterium santillanense]|nr:hypothetical protein [Bifidobacterium santillanense]
MINLAAMMPAAFTTDPKHLVSIIVVAVVVTVASYAVNYFTKRR